MAYSLVFPEEKFFLCSTSAWTSFLEWAKELPKEYTSIKELADKGGVEDTEELGRQLLDAQALVQTNHPVLDLLIEHVGTGAPDESVYVES